jgi:hypothetical protein
VAFASKLRKKTTKPQSGKVVSIPKPAPGTRISQILNTANQSTAAFSTAIIRINKQYQMIHHYLTYHKVRADMILYAVQEQKTKNGSYMIPVMTQVPKHFSNLDML